MKKALLLSVFICCILVSNAQIGWKWGKASDSDPAIEGGFAAADRLGNVYCTGYNNGNDSTRFGPFTLYNPGHHRQLFITKADSSGFIWVKGTQGGLTMPNNIVTDDSGFVYVLGAIDTALDLDTFHLVNTTVPYFIDFLAKIAPDGTVLWVKKIPMSSLSGVGLCIDHSGNTYVSGSFSSPTFSIDAFTVSRSGSGSDICIVKFGHDGSAVSVAHFGSDATNTSIAVTPEKDLYISGNLYGGSLTFGSTVINDTFTYPFGSPQYLNFIAKYDSLGSPQWVKGFNKHVNIACISAGAANAVYFTGWADSNVIIGTDTLPYYGKSDMILGKYTATGTFAWAREIGGTDEDVAYSVAADQCGKVWICGGIGRFFPSVSTYDVNFNGTPITFPYAYHYDPMLVVGYDSAGNNTSNIELLSGGDDQSSIIVDRRGNFFLCGDYAQASLTLGADVLPYPSGEAFFFGKYTYDTVGCTPSLPLSVNNSDQLQDVQIWPNPAVTELTIQSLKPFAPSATIEIADFAGRSVCSYPLTGSSITVPLIRLPAGVYLCRISPGYGSVVTKKLVIIR